MAGNKPKLQIEKDFAPAIYEIVKSCHEFEETRDVSEGQLQATCREIVNSSRKAIGTISVSRVAHPAHCWKRMREHLEPAEFYHQLRKYLYGYDDGPLKGKGIIFEGLFAQNIDVTGLEHLGPQRISGSSAAQSPTLACLDTFLGITHTGCRVSQLMRFPDAEARFFECQRLFMLTCHRELLGWVALNTPAIRNCESLHLMEAKAAIKRFRSAHLQTVQAVSLRCHLGSSLCLLASCYAHFTRCGWNVLCAVP